MAQNADEECPIANMRFVRAICAGSIQYIEHAVENEHFDVNSLDDTRCAALHYVGLIDDIETAKMIIAYLVAKGANVNAVAPGGRTPYSYAIFDGASPEIIDCLLEHGADTTLWHINGVNC